eukprot:scaffold1336_cov100-Skeletonema_dohrnii-CCMP3373.AAC.3
MSVCPLNRFLGFHLGSQGFTSITYSKNKQQQLSIISRKHIREGECMLISILFQLSSYAAAREYPKNYYITPLAPLFIYPSKRCCVVVLCDQYLSACTILTTTSFGRSYHNADYRPVTMERRDFNYYEANAADVNLEEITSSAKNAKILQRLRDGDGDRTLHCLILGGRFNHFYVSEGDDLGWLGFFISRSACLHNLDICYLPDGEQQIHAFSEGIARSQSIRNISIVNLNNDAFTAIMRVLRSLSQLEGLTIWGDNIIDHNGRYELRTLLESGGCKLKQLCLSENNYIGNEGLDVLSNGLRGIGSSLKELRLEHNSIGNQALSTLVEALQTCTSLEKLYLSGNDFSSAAAGLGSLSDWLQRHEVNLHELKLSHCRINDEGLHELFQGVANHCEELYLRGNETITTVGLRYLSDSIRSDSCRVESLDLEFIPIGDEGLEVLAQGLVGNQSLTSLQLGDLHGDVLITSTGWLAFSKALCDTSSVNSTYLSNHTICRFWLFGGMTKWLLYLEIFLDISDCMRSIHNMLLDAKSS